MYKPSPPKWKILVWIGYDFYMFVLGSQIEIPLNCNVLDFVSALQHTFSLTSALFTATFYSKSFLLFCLYWLCQKATKLKHITAILQYLWTLLHCSSTILTGSYLDVKYLEVLNHVEYPGSGKLCIFEAFNSFNRSGIKLALKKIWTVLLNLFQKTFLHKNMSACYPNPYLLATWFYDRACVLSATFVFNMRRK